MVQIDNRLGRLREARQLVDELEVFLEDNSLSQHERRFQQMRRLLERAGSSIKKDEYSVNIEIVMNWVAGIAVAKDRDDLAAQAKQIRDNEGEFNYEPEEVDMQNN